MIYSVLLLVFMRGTLPGVYAQTDAAKAFAFSREGDWKTIYTANLSIMDRLINSNEDLALADLSDEKTFLNLIQMAKQEYVDMVTRSKEAAQRLIKKYNIDIQRSCDVCNNESREIIYRFKSIVIAYQKNPVNYNFFQKAIATIESESEAERCCGWKFYLCCTACAVAIEAFPVYLACCALCLDKYCCR